LLTQCVKCSLWAGLRRQNRLKKKSMTKLISAIFGQQQQFRMRDDLHILRKFWHMGSGLFGLSLYFHFDLSKEQMGTILLSLALIAFSVEFLRLRYPLVNDGVMKFMGPFMRESERDGYSGFPFYALGVSLSLLIFEEKVAILSCLFLIFSDPISSFFGILFGREKILPNKSIQGAIAGFITCYLVTLFYGAAYGKGGLELVLFGICAGVVGMISELLSIIVDDNLTIPLGAGLGLTLINSLIPIF